MKQQTLFPLHHNYLTHQQVLFDDKGVLTEEECWDMTEYKRRLAATTGILPSSFVDGHYCFNSFNHVEFSTVKEWIQNRNND